MEGGLRPGLAILARPRRRGAGGRVKNQSVDYDTPRSLLPAGSRSPLMLLALSVLFCETPFTGIRRLSAVVSHSMALSRSVPILRYGLSYLLALRGIGAGLSG
jgi:hypothetical protein